MEKSEAIAAKKGLSFILRAAIWPFILILLLTLAFLSSSGQRAGGHQQKGNDMGKNQAISLKNAEHYLWGGDCDGWYLVKSENLSVIQERMPPGRYEVRHYHERARQFFFLLSGEAVFELDGRDFILTVHEGIEVPPCALHRIRNASKRDAFFLVVSQPNRRGDKVVIEKTFQRMAIKKPIHGNRRYRQEDHRLEGFDAAMLFLRWPSWP